VLTRLFNQKGKTEALVLARSALILFSIILSLVAVIGIITAPMIVRVFAPGFVGNPWQFDLTVALTRLVFPYVLLIGIVAVSMGVLNVFGHFAAPALAPVMLNIGIIGSVLAVAPFLETPEIALALGVLIGGVMQVALQLPFLSRIGLTLKGVWSFRHPALAEIGRKMFPMAFGAAAFQVNILISTLLATLLPKGAVSYLYYADRLVQFPLGIIAIAAATAALPSFSRLSTDGDVEGLKASLSFTLRLVFFITLPAMVGLIVVREPLVSLLFERGTFDRQTTRLTAEALLYYSIGLWAFSGTRVVVNVYYAVGSIWTPVAISVAVVAANILLSLALMPTMGHAGLALATSIASAMNLAMLSVVLHRRLNGIQGGDIGRSFIKALVMSLLNGRRGLVGAADDRAHLRPQHHGVADHGDAERLCRCSRVLLAGKALSMPGVGGVDTGGEAVGAGRANCGLRNSELRNCGSEDMVIVCLLNTQIPRFGLTSSPWATPHKSALRFRHGLRRSSRSG
jgi:putative peptidoglycan lipid II flippase